MIKTILNIVASIFNISTHIHLDYSVFYTFLMLVFFEIFSQVKPQKMFGNGQNIP